MIWLQIFNKTHKCSSALSCTFVNTSIFQHVNKHISNFFMKNLFNIVFIKMIVLRKEFFYPLRMFFNLLIRSNILAIQNIFFQKLQFFF